MILQKQYVQTNNVVNECFFHSVFFIFCRIPLSNWRKQDSSVHQPLHQLHFHSYVAGASHLLDGPEVNNVPCSRIFWRYVGGNTDHQEILILPRKYWPAPKINIWSIFSPRQFFHNYDLISELEYFYAWYTQLWCNPSAKIVFWTTNPTTNWLILIMFALTRIRNRVKNVQKSDNRDQYFL